MAAFMKEMNDKNIFFRGIAAGMILLMLLTGCVGPANTGSLSGSSDTSRHGESDDTSTTSTEEAMQESIQGSTQESTQSTPSIGGNTSINPGTSMGSSRTSSSSSSGQSAISSTMPSTIPPSASEEKFVTPKPFQQALQKYDDYSQTAYLTAIWAGDTVYQETAVFYTGRSTLQLLYPISQVISVRSYDLTKEYIAGTDYKVTANGSLERPQGSAIPLMTEDISGSTDLQKQLPKHHVSVTYKHTEVWSGGYLPAQPAPKVEKLSNVRLLLESRGKVNAVFYGDSITVGCNASGVNQPTLRYSASADKSAAALYAADPNYVFSMAHLTKPVMPSFPNLVCSHLEQKYSAQVNMINKAVGSTTSAWGAKQENLGFQMSGAYGSAPDLFIIGFGANEITGSLFNYMQNILTIIEYVRSLNGKAEFILLSPMLRTQYASQIAAMENTLYEIAALKPYVAVAPVGSVHLSMTKNKEYIDYSGNAINHPNDFGARIYAQVILSVLGTL